MRALLASFFTIVVIGITAGCATPKVTAAPQADDWCTGEKEQILRAENAEFCDPLLVEKFETRYREWREQCLRVTLMDEQEEVAEKPACHFRGHARIGFGMKVKHAPFAE